MTNWFGLPITRRDVALVLAAWLFWQALVTWSLVQRLVPVVEQLARQRTPAAQSAPPTTTLPPSP